MLRATIMNNPGPKFVVLQTIQNKLDKFLSFENVLVHRPTSACLSIFLSPNYNEYRIRFLQTSRVPNYLHLGFSSAF